MPKKEQIKFNDIETLLNQWVVALNDDDIIFDLFF